MKPAAFDYVAPATEEEALDHLERAGGDVSIIAGGQTLMPLLALRMCTPSVVLDINRIASLKGVTRTDEAMRIGAMTRQNQALASAPLESAFPFLVQAIAQIGHHQTRNCGTIGGSISLGEPAAELPACAVAAGATIEARSTRGVRHIPAEDFYIGPYSSVLEPDELVTSVQFPHWPTSAVSIFREVARRPGDFALVGLVGAIAVDNGKISRAGLAWFGMGPTPMKARRAEAALVGQAVSNLDLRAVAELAVADTDPFDDHAATSDYRQSVGRRIFARTLGEAFSLRQMA